MSNLFAFVSTYICMLTSPLTLFFSFHRLFLADVLLSRIELCGVSGPGVNIIVHLQSRLNTGAEGLTLQTSLAWRIIWTALLLPQCHPIIEVVISSQGVVKKMSRIFWS